MDLAREAESGELRELTPGAGRVEDGRHVPGPYPHDERAEPGRDADRHGDGTDREHDPHGVQRVVGWWTTLQVRLVELRSRVRRTPAGTLAWRVGVGVVGGVLLLAGVAMIPGPGQGWATVLLALAILSTEFSWAHRVRVALWDRLVQARERYEAAGPRRRAVLLGATVLLVVLCLLGAVWLSLLITGLPGWLPDPAADLLGAVPGLR